MLMSRGGQPADPPYVWYTLNACNTFIIVVECCALVGCLLQHIIILLSCSSPLSGLGSSPAHSWCQNDAEAPEHMIANTVVPDAV